MGGGGSAPAAPTLPSPGQIIGAGYKQYLKYVDRIADKETALYPKYANAQYQTQKQYSPLFTDLFRREQEQLNPGVYDLRQRLIGEANAGLDNPIRPEVRSEYLNTLRSEIGSNAGSPIGADYVGTNIARLSEDFRRYYQGLAQSLTGGYPVSTVVPSPIQGAPQGMSVDQAVSSAASYGGAMVGAQASMYGSQMAAHSAKSGSSGIGAGIGLLSKMFF